eukprot:2726777-Pleurochrysis_carterae.AAC.3
MTRTELCFPGCSAHHVHRSEKKKGQCEPRVHATARAMKLYGEPPGPNYCPRTAAAPPSLPLSQRDAPAAVLGSSRGGACSTRRGHT